jgi:hypothetical protein
MFANFVMEFASEPFPDLRMYVCISYLCTYDLYGPIRNVFDACRSITRANGRGWALEIDTFLGPVTWH